MASTNPARGMRDFLPSDIRKRNYVIGIIKEVYESYGFEPLETPAVENLETLMGKYGDEGNQLIFRILKRRDKFASEVDHFAAEIEGSDAENIPNFLAFENALTDLALRYDLTVPLARVVANNKNDLPKFFKRYQIQPVWRADRPAKGRFREFYQCDVDSIGSESMIVEAELISAVGEILRKLGFEHFTIRVNHRVLLSELLAAAGVANEKYVDALVAIDKLDKIGREGVAKEFSIRGVDADSGKKLLIFFESLLESNTKDILGKPSVKKLVSLQKKLADENTKAIEMAEKANNLSGETRKVFEKLNEKLSPEQFAEIADPLNAVVTNIDLMRETAYFVGNLLILKQLGFFLVENSKSSGKGISHLLELLDLIKSTPTSNHVVIEPTLARGLSYYTGTIMEINVPDLAGSLGGGGRYDGLIGMFGKEQIPACGFSLGLERILVVMEERGMFPPEIAESTPADVMVTIWNEETVGESLKLASDLRAQGIRVTVYPEPDKLGKQIKYADSIKVPFVCVLGESEIAENKVTLKNMKTGDQDIFERSSVAELGNALGVHQA